MKAFIQEIIKCKETNVSSPRSTFRLTSWIEVKERPYQSSRKPKAFFELTQPVSVLVQIQARPSHTSRKVSERKDPPE